MPAPALVLPVPADEPDFHDAREEAEAREEEPLDADLALAEDLLHEGSLADAEGFAWRALRCASATPGDVTRAFCVLLQCDFEARRCVLRNTPNGRRPSPSPLALTANTRNPKPKNQPTTDSPTSRPRAPRAAARSRPCP
jgi:hypothetical protein